jgi:hypothetical protein
MRASGAAWAPTVPAWLSLAVVGAVLLVTGENTRLASVYGSSAGEAARAFAQLDLDRNSVLGTAEVAAAISRFFADPDTAAAGNLAFGHL